jgi:predicted hotdog family 3-hydroxylacyl-ACP dehydratase
MQATYHMDQLISHRGSMSLLDQVDDYGDDWLTASALIQADNLFVSNGELPIWVAIEYMAQAIAAYAGIGANSQGEAIKLGFLVGTRKYLCQQHSFAVGSTGTINVKQNLRADNGLAACECEVQGHNCEQQDAWAKASLNVFQPDNADEILKGTA